ncbi:MAG: hypothetical protein R3F29_12690 [Planctomycetota bacterium]
MTLRIKPTLCLLTAIASLAMALPAQEEEGGDPSLTRLKMQRRDKEMEGMSDDDRMKLESREKEEWANLTPEQRLERRTRRGASTHCQFVASVRPAKLLPGQSGTMVVAALLKGNAVLPAPAPVELLRALTEAPVDLGPLAVRPAELGADAQAYRGKPVYENYAWFEIPVTMRQDAKLGDKHRLAVDLKFDLYDGGSAMPIGRFLEQVAAEVEVGAAIDPSVAGHRAPSAQATPAAQPVGSAPVVKPVDEPGPIASGDAIQAKESVDSPAVVPEPSAAPTPAAGAGGGDVLPVASEEGLPMPLLIGGGVFALLLVLLLVLRRK